MVFLVRNVVLWIMLSCVVSKTCCADRDVTTPCTGSNDECCLCEQTCADNCSSGLFKMSVSRRRGCDQIDTTTLPVTTTTDFLNATTDLTTIESVSMETDNDTNSTDVTPTAAALTSTANNDVTVIVCLSSCPSGYYGNSARGVCENCSELCKQCTSFTQCTQCVTGYELSGGICQKKNEESGPNQAAIIGGAAGAIVLVIIVIVVVVCLLRKRKAAKNRPQTNFTKRLEKIRGDHVNPTFKDEDMGDNCSEVVEETINRKEIEEGIYENMPSKDRNLTVKIQNQHDRILRYTKDPTENIPAPKRKGQTLNEDTSDIETLPVAPPVPRSASKSGSQATTKTSAIEADLPITDEIYENTLSLKRSQVPDDSLKRDYQNEDAIRQLKRTSEIAEDNRASSAEDYENEEAIVKLQKSLQKKSIKQAQQEIESSDDEVYENYVSKRKSYGHP